MGCRRPPDTHLPRDLTLRNMGCSATAEKATTLGGRPALDVEFVCQKRPYRGRMRVAKGSPVAKTTAPRS